MATIDICPGCGYPKFGPGLCAFCAPVPAMANDYTIELAPDPERQLTGAPLASAQPLQQTG